MMSSLYVDIEWQKKIDYEAEKESTQMATTKYYHEGKAV